MMRDLITGQERIQFARAEKNDKISTVRNRALELATGEFVIFLDQDDKLAPHALYLIAKEIQGHADVGFVYGDEDEIDEDGSRTEPNFRPDFNPELLYSQNYIGHLAAYRRSLVESAGGFRDGYEGCQDYDLLLRCYAHTGPARVRHIPWVLNSRGVCRSGSTDYRDRYAADAGMRALSDYVQRQGQNAEFTSGIAGNIYRVSFPLPDPRPLVSIVIPTRNAVDLLRTCVSSVLEKTRYDPFEIIVVDNQSDTPETLEYLAALSYHPKCRVLRYDAPFNYSAINNLAVRKAAGEFILLLNNDTEVVTPEWLHELVMWGTRDGVGTVGCKLLYADGTIQHAGIALGVGGVASHYHKHFQADSPGYANRLLSVHEVGGNTAACLLVRRDHYLAVGGLDEDHLAVAFNDVDFCLKLREKGLRNIWTPYAVLYHYESRTRGYEDTPAKQERARAEGDYMRRRWSDELLRDPAYSPNLTLELEDFSLAWPPRKPGPILRDAVEWRWDHRGRLHQNTDGVKEHVSQPEARLVKRRTIASPRILFVSGEPDTPGHIYRVLRCANVLESQGFRTSWIRHDQTSLGITELHSADILVIWRAPWNDAVARLVAIARDHGLPIVFDIDDYMFDPSIAHVEIIDGIRSQYLDETAIAGHYARVRQTMAAAEYCTCATEKLADGLRSHSKPAFVIPNGFDAQTYATARRAVLKGKAKKRDGVIRIGYAAGSRTHQRDFAIAAPAVARILREHPECRLVLFRVGGAHILDTIEFPDLGGLASQIEWRNFVPLKNLPHEISRFDINLAPLEVGNPFCEAKSELKYWEAALVDVPTIASPTGPFLAAIRHGETGFLATSSDEWYKFIKQLVCDPSRRAMVAAHALNDVLCTFGPESVSELAGSFYRQIIHRQQQPATWMFELDIYRARYRSRRVPVVPEFDVIFESQHREWSEIAVVIPLYNYGHFVEETLESVAQQTLKDIDLIVVDDCSTDNSLTVAQSWLEVNGNSFNRAVLLKNRRNSGLALTRNAGFAFSDARYIFPLDADNMILPTCLERCRNALRGTPAAMAYPTIRTFGDGGHLMGTREWDPMLFIRTNYIDAMALISKAAWVTVGGYDEIRFGWEDYSFWCKFIEHGFFGVRVPEILARYRIHADSMLRSRTLVGNNTRLLIEDIGYRHPWLRVANPRTGADVDNKVATLTVSQPRPRNRERLLEILPILRCPVSGEKLVLKSESEVETESGGRRWPVEGWRPILLEGFDCSQSKGDGHLSNPLVSKARDLILQTKGLVLNLSGGGAEDWFPNVIEVEVGLFRNTDVIADAHALPFEDRSFDAVISMNAFEHYRKPDRVVSEIERVLKPSGRVLIHTAFLQPLHEAPWHFYNCTKYGLLEWFKNFNTLEIGVSDNFSPAYTMSWLASEIERLLRKDVGGSDANEFLSAPAGRFVRYWRDMAVREDALWKSFGEISQSGQEQIAAGFELLAEKRTGEG